MSKDAKKITVTELENLLKNTYKLNKDEIKDDIDRLKQGYVLGYNGKHYILNDNINVSAVEEADKSVGRKKAKQSKGKKIR